MPLMLDVHGGYPSYTYAGEEWGQADFDAFKLVQILKGKPINKYASLKKADGKLVTITTANPGPAFELWGEWAAGVVAAKGLRSGLLVPVPSSTCLELGADPKGARLAKEVADRVPGFSAASMLHWNVEYPKASEGGPRDVPTLYENLRIQDGLPPQQIILIDDVVTTGGHAIACARALRTFGHTVEHVVAVAQTVWTHPPNMWAIAPRDIEAEYEASKIPEAF